MARGWVRGKGVKEPVKAMAYKDEAGKAVHPGHKQLESLLPVGTLKTSISEVRFLLSPHNCKLKHFPPKYFVDLVSKRLHSYYSVLIIYASFRITHFYSLFFHKYWIPHRISENLQHATKFHLHS